MRWTSRLLPLGAFLLVLTPFGLSITAGILSQPPAPIATSPRPSLRFGEYLVNLGRINPTRRVRALFRFTNVGETPLEILQIKPSCGCLVPTLPKTTYAPGERGLLIVNPHTTGAGSAEKETVKEYYIDIKYEAGSGPQTERVHVQFILPPERVVVEPKALLVSQAGSQKTTWEITVTDRRDEPVSVTEVTCPRKGFEVAWTPATDPTEAKRATISVTIPAAETDQYATFVKIVFDDPKAAPVRVPIVVRHFQRPTPEVAPTSRSTP